MVEYDFDNGKRGLYMRRATSFSHLFQGFAQCMLLPDFSDSAKSGPNGGALNGLEGIRITFMEFITPQAHLDTQPYATPFRTVRVGRGEATSGFVA